MLRTNRRFLPVAVAGLMALGVAACGDDDDEAPQTTPTTAAQPVGSPSVSIEMTDHAYNVSGPLTSGGTLKISNVGKEFHMMRVGKFKAGKGLPDLVTALSQAGPGGQGPGGQGGSTTTSSVAATTTTSSRSATTESSLSRRRGGVGGDSSGAENSTSSFSAQSQGAAQPQDPTAELFEGELGLPGNFMSPGESAEVTVPNLAPGTYGFVCYIPTEGEGTLHFAKGMVNQLEVLAGTAPPPPTPDATFKLAPGQAVEGPATLAPGRHTLKFEAAAGSEQLEPGIARLNRGTTASQLDTALANLFEGRQPPPTGAAADVPGQIVFGGMDLGSVTNFTVTVDLRASDYVIIAEDTDPENRPKPPKEILNLKVA